MYAVKQRTTAINTALMHYIKSLAQTTRSLVVWVEIRVVLTRCQLLSFAPFWSYLEVKYSILMCAEGKRKYKGGKGTRGDFFDSTEKQQPETGFEKSRQLLAQQ